MIMCGGKNAGQFPWAGTYKDMSALQEEVQQLMQEWEFKDQATAEAFLRAKRHRLQARHKRERKRLLQVIPNLQACMRRLTGELSLPTEFCRGHQRHLVDDDGDRTPMPG